jgi:hypothetical protein
MARKQLYVMADVGRGSLGDKLFPWARCETFRHQWRVPMLAPRWGDAPRVPWIGRRKEGGSQTGSFVDPDWVRGLARLRILLTAHRASEGDFVPGAEDVGGSRRKTLVVFAGVGDRFVPLLPHRELIRRRLSEMLSEKLRRGLAKQPASFVIGVHIHRGRSALSSSRLLQDSRPDPPDHWFVRCIQNLRKVLGFAAPARLFSDAPPNQLAALLSMPNVTLAQEASPVLKLFRLSRSRILLGGAGSSFSQWAAYIGDMPSLWYAGGAPQLQPDVPHFESETDLDGRLNREFSEVIESLSLALNP